MPLFPRFSSAYDGSPVALSGDGTDSVRCVPYRWAGAGGAGITSPLAPTRTPFPATAYFGPGAHNAYVAELGRMLVRRGAGRFHGVPEAQGWRSAAAEGLPGPSTREPLVPGEGRDIPDGASASASGPGEGAPAAASHGVPGCPGRETWRRLFS